MASAEQLLNEAQYAFQSITAGESRENRRNAARARSLCRKIFRKYPGTTEAVVAHGIMTRLGEDMPMPRANESHQVDAPVTAVEVSSRATGETVALDWSGLLAVVLGSSKAVLAAIAFAGFVLFGFLGPLLFLPLLVFIFLTSPLRQAMKPEQRRQLNEFVIQANAWIDERRRSGRGLV